MIRAFDRLMKTIGYSLIAAGAALRYGARVGGFSVFIMWIGLGFIYGRTSCSWWLWAS